MANESNPDQQPGAGQQPGTHVRPTNGVPGHADRGANDHQSAPDKPAASGRGAVVGVVVVLVAIAALAIYGIWKRQHNDEVLADTTERLAAPSVILIAPQPGAPTDTFILPGNVAAFPDSPIYARTSGYLTKWYYDIGAHV